MYDQSKIRALVIGVLAITVFAFTPASFLGGMDKETFWSNYAFGLTGLWFALTFLVSKRDPNKAGSPIRHSTRYMIVDNAQKIVTTLVLLMIPIRFLPDLKEILSANFDFFKRLFELKISNAAVAVIVGGGLYRGVAFIVKMKERVKQKDLRND